MIRFVLCVGLCVSATVFAADPVSPSKSKVKSKKKDVPAVVAPTPPPSPPTPPVAVPAPVPVVESKPVAIAPSTATQRVVVMPLQASEPSLQQLANSTSEAVLTELHHSPQLVAIGQSDIAAMLGAERQRQLLGCASDSTSCNAELSAAFGAKWLLTGSLAKVGRTMRLDLKLLDTDSGQTPFREGRTIEREEALFDVTLALVKELVARTDLWGGAAPKAARPVAPWVVAGVGAVAVIAGGVLLGISAGQYGSITDPSWKSGHTWTLVQSTTNDFNRNVVLGGVIAGVGAAALVGGLVWALVTGQPRAPVALSVSRDGFMFAFSEAL